MTLEGHLATVTSVAPFMVRVDGATATAPAFSIGYTPVLDHRVFVVMHGRRWFVLKHP